VGTGRLRYVGTMERAELLLKNEALRFGADTLVIVDIIESLVGSSKTGGTIDWDGLSMSWRAVSCAVKSAFAVTLRRITSACSERALWIKSFYVRDIGASLMRVVRRHDLT